VWIVADVHEKRSGVPRLLLEAGADLRIESLPAGDYAVGGGALVERKTVRGMHAAIVGGTFWPQLGRLRRAAHAPYLLIEGADLDEGPLTPPAIRGASLAVSDLGVAVIRSTGATDSALWLKLLAERRQRPERRNRPAYAQRPKRQAGTSSAEAALASVPGISTVLARALLSEFGSLEAVVTAREDDWRKVHGIGCQKAAALAATVRAPQPTSHSPRSGE